MMGLGKCGMEWNASTVLGPMKRQCDVSPRSSNWSGLARDGMTMNSAVKDPQGFSPQAVTMIKA